MELIERAASLLPGGGRSEPIGTVHVVDPSPLNWLWITYNTVEELIRVAPDGHVEPAAMTKYAWADDRTLDVDVREGTRFPDGERLTAASVKRAFDEVIRWAAPHPPAPNSTSTPAPPARWWASRPSASASPGPTA